MSSPPPERPLTDFRHGDSVVVGTVNADGADEVRLKRMGVCAGRRLDVVQAGDPMIIRVVGARVGLSRRLAERILGTACPVCSPERAAATEGDAG